MNIQHLKYALEISKTHSLNKAADNLYMAQPNLSRAIKELEESLGITIFDRTSKGMLVTPEGEEFLRYAAQILHQINEVEELYTKGKRKKQTFSISVPRATYISYAFSQFARQIDQSNPSELYYKETNSLRAINNILHADYKLGILRYANNYDKYYHEMLDEKGLKYETVTEFTYRLIMSKSHPLAEKDEIVYDDLTHYTEIAHADPYVPSLSMSAVKKDELPDNIDKRIFVFERASQFELLENVPGTFMWVSPVSDGILEKHNLVQRPCKDNSRVYKDVLIYRKDYKLTALDKMFIAEVENARKKYM